MAHAPFGGMTWQVIHYLLGLRDVGLDVWYVEDSNERMLDLSVSDWTRDPSENARFVDRHLTELGFGDRWVLRVPDSKECHGALTWAELLRLYRETDLVINLCGSHQLLPHHDRIRHLLYLETDPVANQVAVASGSTWTREELEHHQSLVTYATNIDGADCLMPHTDLRWTTSVPPVALSQWQTTSEPSNGAFTTVMNWSAPHHALAWQDRHWEWSKRASLLRVCGLPSLSPTPVEVALRQADESVRSLLRDQGWRVLEARTIDAPRAYRDYVKASLGEVSVAKDQYVAPRSGWISDRTICYLAAGRPAVVERTHISGVPLGVGLLDFQDAAEAAAALNEVVADYPRHATAARELAREYFAADRVVARMLNDVGLG